MLIASPPTLTGSEIDDGLLRAMERCSRAIDFVPSKALWDLVAAGRTRGLVAQAGELLDRFEARQGESVRSLEERARIETARGDDDAALAALTRRRERSPCATAEIAVARLHLAQGDISAASEILESVKRTDGHLQSVRQFEIEVATAAGNHELARAEHLKSVDERGESATPLFALARLSVAEGDLESASAFFERGLRASGD